MKGKWVKKDKPAPLTLLEKDKLTLLEWGHRTAFWARRKVYASQPRHKSFAEESAICSKTTTYTP